MISGCRYERAIKQSLNKVFDNKSSVNTIIAELIASYSHKTLVRPGSYLLCRSYHFFIVSDVLSQHWCMGFFCPPIIILGNYGSCAPDIKRRTPTEKKCIFDPFDHPYVSIREQKFHLESKIRYEPVPDLPTLFT